MTSHGVLLLCSRLAEVVGVSRFVTSVFAFANCVIASRCLCIRKPAVFSSIVLERCCQRSEMLRSVLLVVKGSGIGWRNKIHVLHKSSLESDPDDQTSVSRRQAAVHSIQQQTGAAASWSAAHSPLQVNSVDLSLCSWAVDCLFRTPLICLRKMQACRSTHSFRS